MTQNKNKKEDEIPLNFQVKINYVIFIESLEYPETTQNLYNDIVRPRCKSKRISTKYISVQNKSELVGILMSIRDSSSLLYPLIHFAAHGDTNGLGLKDDYISWDELATLLQIINVNSKNHLILSMASCFGAFGLSMFKGFERAPYYLLIGPTNKIKEDLLDNKILTSYYSSFFIDFNVFNALKNAKKENELQDLPFQVASCVQLLYEFTKIRKEKLKSGQARHDIIKSLKERFPEEIPYSIKSKVMYDDQIEKMSDFIFRKLKNKFLMIDLYKENEVRFQNLS